MAKQYLISEFDYNRIQVMLRAFEQGTLKPQTRRRGISIGGGGSSGIRKAFVKTTPTTTTTVDCYLNTDATGKEVTVTCEITGGGTKLNEANPRLVDGCMFYVVYDSVDKLWRSLFPFQRINIAHHNVVGGKFSSLIFECT